MRLGVAALCVAIVGCVYLLQGRTPDDGRAVTPPSQAALAEPAVEAPAFDDGFPLRAQKRVKAARSPRKQALPRFRGKYFSIAYPSGWRVDAAETSMGAYLDTTIRHPASPSVYLRVDVTPSRGADPVVHAREVEGYLRRQETYRRHGFARARLGGFPALRWDFGVVEEGVRLRKVDVFLTDGGKNRIAVLTQAPHAEFERYEALFARLRASLVPRA
jgi:hypothetical protein